MRTVYVDSDRHQWISTGNVEPMQKWVDIAGKRQRTDEQETGPTGLPRWSVEIICPPDAGDDRSRTEVARITVEAPSLPDIGAFGTLLQFENLTMQVWPGRDGKSLGQSFTATGVRLAGQPTGRTSRREGEAA